MLPALGALCLFFAVQLVRLLSTKNGRFGLVIRIRRAMHHEFWPSWFFYIPLVPWISGHVLRFGWRSMTAVNPVIPYSGICGESKIHILRHLPDAIPSAVVPVGRHEKRFRVALGLMRRHSWSYPLIVKPNASQRGVGLKNSK